MLLRNWTFLMFGFGMTYPRLSAKFCMRSYVDGKWILEGDCGGRQMMSAITMELQLRSEEEKKSPAAKGWIVFQRRMNGHEDFYRGWNDYVKGFGNSEGEFWLGLEELHERTKYGNMELEIHMTTNDTGIHLVAKYSNFQVGPGSDKYRLTVSGFSGNASHDALTYHNNRQFSTKDADHDNWSRGNCASDYKGAWWYINCGHSNLNGNFNKTDAKGIWWRLPYRILRYTEMKVRRKL